MDLMVINACNIVKPHHAELFLGNEKYTFYFLYFLTVDWNPFSWKTQVRSSYLRFWLPMRWDFDHRCQSGIEKSYKQKFYCILASLVYPQPVRGWGWTMDARKKNISNCGIDLIHTEYWGRSVWISNMFLSNTFTLHIYIPPSMGLLLVAYVPGMPETISPPPAFRRIHNPQLYVSGKRTMFNLYTSKWLVQHYISKLEAAWTQHSVNRYYTF